MMKVGPSEIVHRNMRFVIIDRPTKSNVQQYVNQLKKHNTSLVVRVCEATYDDKCFENEGIVVREMMYEDGAEPSATIIKEWLVLVKKMFVDKPKTAVAVHCVAGLGRAPVLVAIALIDGGMRYEDAVEFIRRHRQGAINARQLAFLERYKASSNKKGCIIM